MVFGTFDGIHAGHVFLLQQARELADELVVVVGRDARVTDLKKRPPMHTEDERLMLIQSLSLVDTAILGDRDDVYTVVREYSPEYILLGYDQTFFTEELEKKIKEFQLNTKVVRAKRYKEGQHKSSKMHPSEEQKPAFRQMIVPIALVIKNGELLMTLRNDPENPRFHKKWELPGGKLQLGENLADCVIRETQEEVDYIVEIVTPLSRVNIMEEKEKNYQVCLIPHVVKIIGGEGNHSDREVIEKRFFPLDEVLQKDDLIPENLAMFQTVFQELKQVIEKYGL